MGARLLRILEVCALRAGPGFINLYALLLLGGWLGLREYGLYSTAVATSSFLGNLVFGPITFSVVSQYAVLQNQGRARDYEASLFSAALILAAVIVLAGAALAVLDLVDPAWISPLVSFGVYTAVQEIHHARLRLWRFGAAALLQSVLFVGLIWLFVRGAPTPERALLCFSASFGVAIVASLALSGFPPIRRPDMALLKATFGVGAPYTVSMLAENALYLGFRYLLLASDNSALLGVFSYCVDLAQRFVGFLINAASFSFVPRAFASNAKGEEAAFYKELWLGVLTATGLAVCAVGVILVAWATRSVEALTRDIFDPVTFILVSLAVVVNRGRKMALDPLVVRARRATAIMLGYLLAAPIAMGAALTLSRLHAPYAIESSYLLGYLLAALATVSIYLRLKNRSPRAE